MTDEMRDEYEFDYSQARPNRFATLARHAGRPGPAGPTAPATDAEPVNGVSGRLLQPSDIVDEVRAVLAAARRGKWDRPNFLTAFQILDRLPEPTRSRLIGERTAGGANTGTAFAAPSVVSKAAEMAGAEIEYLDSVGLTAEVAGRPITPGYEVCGVYRLPTAAPADL